MAQGAPEMLASSSGPPDYVRVITQLQTELYQMWSEMNNMATAMVQHTNNQNQGNREPKELRRWRSIQSVPQLNG